MNAILAFLLTLQTANPQPVSLKQLLAQLQIKPFDESAVQRKLAEIVAANPEIEATFNHFKAQLEAETDISLPKIDIDGKILTRSGLPGEPDKETSEITNFAVTILKNENPADKARELLQPLNDKLIPVDKK